MRPGIRKQLGRVGLRSLEPLGNSRLEILLQLGVHLGAADIDVDLDAVPAGIVGVEGRPGAGPVLLFEGGNRSHERRAHGFDAGDLEALRLRRRADEWQPHQQPESDLHG